MQKLTEWKAADGSTLKINSSSTTSSSTQQKFEDFTDFYKQLIDKIKKEWSGVSVIRCAAHVLELKFIAGAFRRHILIQYNEPQKTFTVTLKDPTTNEQIESGTCYRGILSVLIFLMKNGIIRDTKLEESVSTVNKTIEAFECYCSSCRKTVMPDQNLSCPNCGEPLDNELLDFALANAADKILIFTEDGNINKKDLKVWVKGHSPIGDNALVLPVNPDFFDLIEPDIHDRTKSDSSCGKILLNKKSKEIQAILNMLKTHAIKYVDLKNKTKTLFDSLSYADEFNLYENLWKDIESLYLNN